MIGDRYRTKNHGHNVHGTIFQTFQKMFSQAKLLSIFWEGISFQLDYHWRKTGNALHFSVSNPYPLKLTAFCTWMMIPKIAQERTRATLFGWECTIGEEERTILSDRWSRWWYEALSHDTYFLFFFFTSIYHYTDLWEVHPPWVRQPRESQRRRFAEVGVRRHDGQDCVTCLPAWPGALLLSLCPWCWVLV